MGRDEKVNKICILISDGVGVKNYLFSDLLPLMDKQGINYVVLHPFGGRLPIENNVLQEQAHLEFFKEPFFVRLWREAICYARLHFNALRAGNDTIITNWMPNKSTLSSKLLFNLAEFLGKKWKSENRILKQETWLNNLVKRSSVFKAYRKQLEHLQIDFLLCTHQRVPAALPIILAAKGLEIKTATVIFSWDNIPKARLPFRSDLYFVWSQYMKEELRFYYSDIREDQIKITGTPQFDHYQDSVLIEKREVFAQKYGLDPDKSWLLFSGDDRLTSPFDAEYLKDVAEAIKIEPELQLLFRQVPVESTDRYDEVLNANDIIHIPPLWQSTTNWRGFIPTKEDIVLLVNLSFHCKVVINVGSTMALDFSCFDNIGLYLNYDQPHGTDWSVDTIYKFQHFQTMAGLEAVGWINNRQDILSKIKQAIEAPESIARDRQKWRKRVVADHDKLSAERLVEAIVL